MDGRGAGVGALVLVARLLRKRRADCQSDPDARSGRWIEPDVLLKQKLLLILVDPQAGIHNRDREVPVRIRIAFVTHAYCNFSRGLVLHSVLLARTNPRLRKASSKCRLPCLMLPRLASRELGFNRILVSNVHLNAGI